MKYVLLYILTFIVFLAIDAVWLLVISKNLYSKEIGHLMAEKALLLPALIFYLLFVVGVLIFAVLPGYEAQSLSKTLMLGALLGLMTYATYDLTNLATLRDWPIKITIIDIIWGTSLSTLTGLAGYYIAKFINL
ncbi:MAG: hypothetical protein XD93_0659 [candidate division WS6 bacterium 34_10]|uniref:Transmembrane(S)protein n=1 Tax=candidate division WS6 bacterium 34_10 TaxID=1641389 RepID=A0A101HHG2_9BACT|nr:MAG: hypothetical protein XD93_0659 [candidate division WS6 bacterium 34_10]